MSELVAKNRKYVSDHPAEFDESKFYIEDDVVREVYYNPDSNAGGQLVTNFYDRSSVVEANELYDNIDDFWSCIDCTAKQYLTDIDTLEFMSQAKEFVESPCDFNESRERFTNILCAWADLTEQKPLQQGMQMSSM